MYNIKAEYTLIYDGPVDDGSQRTVHQIAVSQDGLTKMLLGWQSDRSGGNPVPDLIKALQEVAHSGSN